MQLRFNYKNFYIDNILHALAATATLVWRRRERGVRVGVESCSRWLGFHPSRLEKGMQPCCHIDLTIEVRMNSTIKLAHHNFHCISTIYIYNNFLYCIISCLLKSL